jgi:hypothetical protein
LDDLHVIGKRGGLAFDPTDSAFDALSPRTESRTGIFIAVSDMQVSA